MDRSLGFGSTAHNYVALLRLGFPTAPERNSLTLLCTVTRRLIMQEARGHTSLYAAEATIRYSAPTDCRHAVSGSISLPTWGAFHLSLTVLVHYRSSGVLSLGGWSPRIPTGFLVSRGTWENDKGVFILSPTGLLPSMAEFS